MVDFDFIYKDFIISHPVGDLPQLDLIFDLEATLDKDEGVYIPSLRYNVSLCSTKTPEHPGRSHVGDWGTFESFGPEKLFKRSGLTELFFTIPMSSQKIQQLIDVRSQGKLPRLDIILDGHYLFFKRVDGLYQLDGVNPFRKNFKKYFKNKPIEGITFTTDEIIKLLEEIKQYELVRIEIPVQKGRTSTNKLIAEVVNILDGAKRDLLAGNYDGVLKGVRDSLENRILERDKEKKCWVLNGNIKNNFLKSAPINAQEEYKEMLKRIGNQFRSQLRIINDVYMHKKKTRVYPRPQDAEQILFVTAFLVRYLSQTCISD